MITAVSVLVVNIKGIKTHATVENAFKDRRKLETQSR